MRAAVMACALLASCGVHMDVPDGFLELGGGEAALRATSPDGARLVVQDFVDRDRGTLEFWAEALEHDYEQERGYVREDRTEITDGAGQAGIAWRYRVYTAGEPHGYLVALFAADGRIRIVELVAPSDVFDARVDAVRDAVATLR